MEEGAERPRAPVCQHQALSALVVPKDRLAAPRAAGTWPGQRLPIDTSGQGEVVMIKEEAGGSPRLGSPAVCWGRVPAPGAGWGGTVSGAGASGGGFCQAEGPEGPAGGSAAGGQGPWLGRVPSHWGSPLMGACGPPKARPLGTVVSGRCPPFPHVVPRALDLSRCPCFGSGASPQPAVTCLHPQRCVASF